MFKKTNRLTKVEFSEFYSKGNKNHFPCLTVITFPHQQTKVSVVVGKKVAKSAVRRNVLKRRVYATLRKIELVNNSKNVLIIILKPTYNNLTRKVASETLEQAVAQVIKPA